MQARSDVIVIGGGPSGSFTALGLAKRGLRVDVFEEHDEIGVPSHCPGHLNIKGLQRLGLYPLPSGVVQNTFRGAIFHSPKGEKFTVRLSSPVTCVVNRSLFDKHIADIAEKAGVQYRLNSPVESLTIENENAKVIKAKRGGHGIEECFSRVVVDAEGVSSRILKQIGLSPLNRGMVVNGVQAEIDNVDVAEPDMVEVFLGREYARGFYAWLIPTLEGTAKVGLATKGGNPKMTLQRFMLKHPSASKKLRKARILNVAFHPITLGGPIPQAYSDGFVAVGDVASQVKSTTGGGVILGMTCGGIAAEIIREALEQNDCSGKFLNAYQTLVKETLGFDLSVMLRIRKALNAMSDTQMNRVISLCNKLDLEKTLSNLEDIDLQGRSLIHLLRSPRMLTALSYFFFLYLAANP